MRRIAFVKKIFALLQRFHDRDFRDVFQIRRRQAGEKLAAPQRVDDGDFFEFGDGCGHDSIQAVLAPKVNHPIAVRRRARLLTGEPFAGQFLDQRRRQKRRDDNQAFVRLERVHALADFGKWLDAAADQVAHVKAFELVQRRHGSMRYRLLWNVRNNFFTAAHKTFFLQDNHHPARRVLI